MALGDDQVGGLPRAAAIAFSAQGQTTDCERNTAQPDLLKLVADEFVCFFILFLNAFGAPR